MKLSLRQEHGWRVRNESHQTDGPHGEAIAPSITGSNGIWAEPLARLELRVCRADAVAGGTFLHFLPFQERLSLGCHGVLLMTVMPDVPGAIFPLRSTGGDIAASVIGERGTMPEGIRGVEVAGFPSRQIS